MKEYDLKQFIGEFVLPDLGKMIEQGLHYYAFALICQTIEVMGSIYDQKGIDDHGASETRFDNALTNLFRDKRYKEKQQLFYSYLRGPLIHQLRPGQNVYLSSQQKDGTNPKNHLLKQEAGCVILVIERFYEDLQDAYKTFCRELEKRRDLDHKKVDSPFIYVRHMSTAEPSTCWNETAQTNITVTPAITGRA
jgi:hypothetical protein